MAREEVPPVRFRPHGLETESFWGGIRLLGRNGRSHDFGKSPGIKACPAHQSPVDIGLGKEFTRIIRSDTATVEDASLVRH